MIRYIFVLVVLLFLSCTTQSQSLNNEIIKEGKRPYLLGKINEEGLSSENYNLWFQSGFDTYKPNTEIVDKLSKKLKEYKILAFMGTWCGDSRREIPKFYKILDAVKYPLNQLTMVAVSSEPGMYKQSPNHEEEGLNIHRVPTFIFYKNGKEINRIVEHPVTTLEEDMLNIINKNYVPNYHVVSEVSNLIEKPNFYDEAIQNLPKLKALSKNMFELNTYGRILSSKNKTAKAIDVFKLNTKLFPEQPRTYMSLANTLGANGNKEKAIKVLEEALKIHPDNKQLQGNLQIIKSN